MLYDQCDVDLQRELWPGLSTYCQTVWGGSKNTGDIMMGEMLADKYWEECDDDDVVLSSQVSRKREEETSLFTINNTDYNSKQIIFDLKA